MEFECWACGKRVEHDVTKKHKPFHWHSRKIAGQVRFLCDGCGHNAHFNDGISEYLRDLIKRRHGTVIDENGDVVE